ncbi:hypothetical protein H5410_015218 [Solanum commersonii]|uniref:G-patch domain-containing protein n=1 Tax=Solanum commersonii TaxID=4109 RepID=A0A9J5ZTR4_SOLCO|nr:hypothetical protein H5410_015218 [Solanum commersonii]
MTNTKTVPWNYNKVIVTHKGNEIIEETNETRGLTRFGRLKINTDRIRTNNACVRAFDGAKRDTLGEICIIVTFGPVEFGITFQARAVPSTLHQVVKFEHDKLEIIVHGEDDLPITQDLSIPCIEAKRGCESLNYQSFEIITVNQFLERNPIPQPHLSSASIMVVSQMVQNGYEPGKGLGLSLQGIVDPINLMGNQETFSLGFNPTRFDRKWAKDRKRKVWNLLKPIPHIAQSFVKSRGEPCPDFPIPNDVDEICQGIKEMFYDVNMTQMGEGTSHMDVQFIGPNVQLNNWEVTPLPTRRESW